MPVKKKIEVPNLASIEALRAPSLADLVKKNAIGEQTKRMRGRRKAERMRGRRKAAIFSAIANTKKSS